MRSGKEKACTTRQVVSGDGTVKILLVALRMGKSKQNSEMETNNAGSKGWGCGVMGWDRNCRKELGAERVCEAPGLIPSSQMKKK